jgi:hypothetical protein
VVKRAEPPYRPSGKGLGSSVVIQSARGDDACCPRGESSVEKKVGSTSDWPGQTFV